jgi:hypothetical protein
MFCIILFDIIHFDGQSELFYITLITKKGIKVPRNLYSLFYFVNPFGCNFNFLTDIKFSVLLCQNHLIKSGFVFSEKKSNT